MPENQLHGDLFNQSNNKIFQSTYKNNIPVKNLSSFTSEKTLFFVFCLFLNNQGHNKVSMKHSKLF